MSDTYSIPEHELQWSFVRSGGPGGQNVNKVASKAVLRWDLERNLTVPPEVKMRLRTLHRNRITREGELVISSQRFRDQERNREDCLEKLREMLIEAAKVPKMRKATRPSRGSKVRRLREKHHHASIKAGRRTPRED